MITDDQLKEIRARCDKATPGGWRIDSIRNIYQLWGGEHTYIGDLDPENHSDVFFIVASRTDVPALLDHIEEQDARLDHYRLIERRYRRMLLQQLSGMSHKGAGPETVYFSDGLKGNVEVLEWLEEAGLFVRVGDGKPGHIYGRLTEAGLRLLKNLPAEG